jgi:large subunit ribosomal protein L4
MSLTIDVINAKGDKLESLPLSEGIFGVKPYSRLVHEVVTAYLANERRGTHSTKTRGEVSGGGKKPWKQKHTGNARSGSNRSPLWRHGGIIFGPKPHRGYLQPISGDKRRLALKASLSDYLKQGRLKVVDAFAVSEGKTKKVAGLVKAMAFPPKTLLIVDKVDAVLEKGARNLAGFSFIRAKDLNAYDVLSADLLVFTKAGLAEINQRLESDGSPDGAPSKN